MHDILHIDTSDGTQPIERFGEPSDSGVIVYMDGFGVRDELRDMCRRFSEMGYTTYLPNMYYRHGGPSFAPPNTKGDTPNAEAQALNKATTVEMSVSDTRALITIEPAKRWAVVGYCMGGRHAIGAAATFPEMVTACLSVHGGQMISHDDWSCEKLIAKTRADVFLGFAKDDSSCPENHKSLLRAALNAPGVTGTAMDFDALHGWSFADRHCFDSNAADTVWRVAEAMFDKRLAA